MYKEHRAFEKPNDENIKIWRYLDFTKLVSLLDKQALFFCRADKLLDPFEGSYSKANIQLRPKVYKGILSEKVQTKLSDIYDYIRKCTIVNCWHISEHESAAMWKLYLKSDEGVAIQSTFKRLVESFNDYLKDVYIGKVKYIDYKTDLIPEGNLFFPYLHKRKSFEYEHELRAIIGELPTKRGGIDFEKSYLTSEHIFLLT